MSEIKKVEELIEDSLRKNQPDIEMALIRPLSPEYPFSTNGIYFLIGKMERVNHSGYGVTS